MKKVSVTFWTKHANLCEISQQVGMKYAFLSVDNKQCHPWIKCRDFLHDALRCQVTGKKDGIYGFNFDPEVNPPLDLKKMRMLVKRDPHSKEKNPSEVTKEAIYRALSIIRCIETKAGIKTLSKLHVTDEDEDIYIFEGPRAWMGSPFMISLYTLLIRLGAKKIEFDNVEELDAELKRLSDNEEKSSDNDIRYLKVVQPYIHKIVENRKKLKYVGKDNKPLFFVDKGINIFHNYTGVVSLTQHLENLKKKMNLNGLEDLTKLSQHIA